MSKLLTPENKIFVLMFGGAVVVFLVLAGLVLATPPSAPAVNLVNYGKINNFNLINQDNNTVTLDTYNSSDILIINFFYTHCGDLPNSTVPGCNAEAAKLNTVMGTLQNEGYTPSQFHIVSISFDYRFDNVSSVRAYGLVHGEGQFNYWSFLTGNKSQMLNVTSSYGFCEYYYDNSNPATNQTNLTCEQYAYLSSMSAATSTAQANDINTISSIGAVDHGDPNVTTGYEHSFLVIVADKNRDIRQLYTGTDWKASDMVNVIKALLSTNQ